MLNYHFTAKHCFTGHTLFISLHNHSLTSLLHVLNYFLTHILVRFRHTCSMDPHRYLCCAVHSCCTRFIWLYITICSYRSSANYSSKHFTSKALNLEQPSLQMPEVSRKRTHKSSDKPSIHSNR